MKHFRLFIILLLAGCCSLTNAQTTYNDTVRSHTWSMHLQLGASNHHDMRGDQYVGNRHSAPLANIGVAYNLSPAWRIGFNMGYTYLHCLERYQAPLASALFGFSTPIEYRDRNITHLLVTDLMLEYNLMDLKHQRRVQRLNIWLGVGVGYLHGWNSHTVNGRFVTTGTPEYHFTEQQTSHVQSDALCIPISLAVERDLSPNWTVGVNGQYRAVPLNIEHTPHGLWNLTAVVRYNWGGHKTKQDETSGMMMQKLLESYRDQAQYRDLLRQAAADNSRLTDEQQAMRSEQEALRRERDSLLRENDRLTEVVIDLRDERARLRKEVGPTKAAAAKKVSQEVQQTADTLDSPAPTAQPVPAKAKQTATAIPATAATTPTEDNDDPEENSDDLGDTNIYFAINSARLNESSLATIRAIAEELQEHPEKRIYIIGYSSSTGSAAYNLSLSKDRIKAVRNALVRAGVKNNQIVGSRANGKTRMGKGAKSRRVSILIK